MDLVCKAIADPVRRDLLERLSEHNGQTVQQLARRLPISRQAVSKHLAILEGASLVVPLWQGHRKLHYINPFPLQELAEGWLTKFRNGPREEDSPV